MNGESTILAQREIGDWIEIHVLEEYMKEIMIAKQVSMITIYQSEARQDKVEEKRSASSALCEHMWHESLVWNVCVYNVYVWVMRYYYVICLMLIYIQNILRNNCTSGTKNGTSVKKYVYV